MKNKIISLIIITFLLVLVINVISAQANSIEKLREAGFTEEELRLAFPEEFIEYNDFDEEELIPATLKEYSVWDYINAYKFNLLALVILIVLILVIIKYRNKIKEICTYEDKIHNKKGGKKIKMLRKKSYDPFKMWESWVGAIIGFSALIFMAPQQIYLSEIFTWYLPSFLWVIPTIIGFLTGWGIHSLIRKLKEKNEK